MSVVVALRVSRACKYTCQVNWQTPTAVIVRLGRRVICLHMATDCTGEAVRGVYLDAVERYQRLCEPCIAYAERAGMNPRDRRAVERLPEWRKRSLAKVLDSWRVAS